jgi:hypothetical protein
MTTNIMHARFGRRFRVASVQSRDLDAPEDRRRDLQVDPGVKMLVNQ